MNKKEKEQLLLRIWLRHKYWQSCCEDEALDWCNHSEKSLDSVEEIVDYTEWRNKVEALVSQLKKLVESRYFTEDLPNLFH